MDKKIEINSDFTEEMFEKQDSLSEVEKLFTMKFKKDKVCRNKLHTETEYKQVIELEMLFADTVQEALNDLKVKKYLVTEWCKGCNNRKDSKSIFYKFYSSPPKYLMLRFS